VLFHDMGNVFASTGDLFPSLVRWTQKNRSSCQLVSLSASCDFNFMAHAVGGGIRYKTPIGPVRLDVGYNLNPALFPIRSYSTFATVRQWNFFFSIGQTF
jgi:outer membrane protein assembly factor BamA